MLDFYLIVSDYDAAYGGGWKARANRLLPPNVFPCQHDGLAGKYAVLSEDDFHRPQPQRSQHGQRVGAVRAAGAAGMGQRRYRPRSGCARHIWGRRRRCSTPRSRTAPQAEVAVLELWRIGFALTYAAELRAERGGPRGVGGRFRAGAVPRVRRRGAAGLSDHQPGGRRYRHVVARTESRHIRRAAALARPTPPAARRSRWRG